MRIGTLLGGGALAVVTVGACAITFPYYTAEPIGGEGIGGAGGGSTSVGSGMTTTTGGSSTSTSSFLAVSSSSSSGGSCTESPCKLTSPQCGCGANQACSIVNYMPACQPAGTTAQGEGCSAPDACAPGLLCVGSGSAGICYQFCATDADCAALGGICALDLGNGTPSGSIPNATLCSTDCNPTTSSGCSVSGTSCQVQHEATGQMRFLTLCAGSGTSGHDEPCTTSSNCLPTYGCLNDGTADVCLQYCNVEDPSSCGGMACSAIEDTATMAPVVVNGITLGSCP